MKRKNKKNNNECRENVTNFADFNKVIVSLNYGIKSTKRGFALSIFSRTSDGAVLQAGENIVGTVT